MKNKRVSNAKKQETNIGIKIIKSPKVLARELEHKIRKAGFKKIRVKWWSPFWHIEEEVFLFFRGDIGSYGEGNLTLHRKVDRKLIEIISNFFNLKDIIITKDY